MGLRIEHTTTLRYTQHVSEAHTEVRLAPFSQSGQHRVRFSLTTEPRSGLSAYMDRYGNEVHYFDILPPHQQLVVRAVAEMLTPAHYTDESGAFGLLDAFDFLQPGVYTSIDSPIAALGRSGGDITHDPGAALQIMHAVHNALVYTKGATSVRTTAPEAMAIGKGVCQDFAHVMIAACRSAGIPARYVSGYLHGSGGGAMASHAWVDARLQGGGWVSLDPTHDCEQTEHYVRVAVGRDYADVPPTRGVFKGNAVETMDVEVAVREL